MALLNLKIFSESLGVQTQVNVILPQESVQGEIGTTNAQVGGNYKVLYLLHGLSDDQTIWLRRTSIERYAQEYGICVVMPYGDRSFYTDMRYGGKYYTYISKELPAIIQSFFKVSEKPEDTFIAGLSMGGYGALKTALRESGRYAAVAGLSSVADIEESAKMFSEDYVAIFGESIEIPDRENLFRLAETCPNRPRIFMGVGTSDMLYQDNVRLKEHLEKLGYDLTYRESAGAHTWAFWDEYIQYVLAWMFGEK